MTHIKRVFSAWGAPALGLFIAGSGSSQTVLSNQYYEVTSLSGATVEMYGRSELHITGSNTPISGCTINMRPMDSWVFLHAVKPSAASSLLGQFRVNGLNAVLNSNVQVVQYGQGAVVIPYPSGFQPMTVYDSENFRGASMNLTPYTQYGTSQLGSMASKVSSFTLKRGYTATVAQNTDGTGASVNYVAADGDLEIGALPDELNDQVNFVRIFPWRWTSKKGIAGNIGSQLNVQWWYNWNIDQNSTLDKEYVPIRQQRWWPSLNQNWQTRGASHLLGYNEPNHTDQANMTVGDAIGSWPDLLGTGLRVGSPAPADDGRSWLYSFMSQADAADLRVDFVAVHYYWCYNPADPAGAANQMYDYLLDVYHHTHKPIWITEWNNGANWTGCGDPTHAQQAACISAMVDMLDNTPWVERYAPYNWVEDARRLEWNDGYPTDAGLVYRDQPSPIGYRQAMKQNRSRGARQFIVHLCRLGLLERRGRQPADLRFRQLRPDAIHGTDPELWRKAELRTQERGKHELGLRSVGADVGKLAACGSHGLRQCGEALPQRSIADADRVDLGGVGPVRHALQLPRQEPVVHRPALFRHARRRSHLRPCPVAAGDCGAHEYATPASLHTPGGRWNGFAGCGLQRQRDRGGDRS